MDREPLLGKYDKRKDMTEVQKLILVWVVHYNSILGKIAEKYDIEKWLTTQAVIHLSLECQHPILTPYLMHWDILV
jgi:hypothetical protein